jgi:hypothetical protein
MLRNRHKSAFFDRIFLNSIGESLFSPNGFDGMTGAGPHVEDGSPHVPASSQETASFCGIDG